MKKKSHKRMMDGGMAGVKDRMLRGQKAMRGKPAPMGRRMPSKPTNSAVDMAPNQIKRPMPMPSKPTNSAVDMAPNQIKRPMPMPVAPPPRTPPVAMPMTSSQTGSVSDVAPVSSRAIGGGIAPGKMMQPKIKDIDFPIDARDQASLSDVLQPTMRKGGKVQGKKMRGGGLARKGVGMALAKGGLAKRAGGCAKRGVGRGKMV